MVDLGRPSWIWADRAPQGWIHAGRAPWQWIEEDGGGGGMPGTRRRQRWIGLGGPVDGLSGLVNGLFLFSDLFTKAGKQMPLLILD